MKEKYTGDTKTDADHKYPGMSKKYVVMFRQNRSFDLKIGRRNYRFEPFGVQELTKEEVEHPDFIQQKDYFTIKEY